MKPFLIFLIALLPFAAFGQQYQYHSVTVMASGADNFRVQQTECVEQTGLITVATGNFSIDGEKYRVKKLKKNKLFRTDKGLVKFVFNKQQKLAAVQVLRFHTLRTYHIENREVSVASAN